MARAVPDPPSDEDDDEPEITVTKLARSKRTSKMSEKLKYVEKENLDKAEQQLTKLKQKIAKLKKAGTSKARKMSDEDNDEDGSEQPDIESEDEDEDNIMFSSSIKPLQPIVIQDKTPEIRRINLRKEFPTTKVSRRAFISLPIMSPAVSLSSPDDAVHADNHEQLPSAPDEGEQEQMLPSPSLRNKRPHSSDSDHAAPPAHKKQKPALLEVALRPSLRLADIPKLSDFSDGTVRALILRAIREYEILICAKGAFPSLSVRAQWGESCWANAQKDARSALNSDSESPDLCYEFTDRILRLMMRRGSRIRGDLLKPVCAQVMSCYRLREGAKARDMQKNAKVVSSLLFENSFHYKDPKTQEGYCENPIIVAILCGTWFKDLKSAGVIYKHYFDPISIDTLSLFFTLVHFCLKEWSTGKHVQAEFTETDQLTSYQTFRIDINRWQNLNLAVTTNKRKKMFMRASKKAGMVDVTAPKPQLVGDAEGRARKELEGHTGATDSEADDDAAGTGDEST